MSGPDPEELVPRPVVQQGWRDVSFLHWAYPPETVSALLPPGLEVDTFDGQAWVGLTPFLVTGSRPPFVPALPRFSSFPETNLRTYVRDPSGRDGLWFFSLEVDSVATTIGARVGYGVPYQWATMSVSVDDVVTYRSRRRGSRTGHDITIRPGPVLDPSTPFDHWLTGRWRAFTSRASQLFDVAVRHQPWPLHTASIEHLDETLRGAAGLGDSDTDPLVHFSPGVDAHLGAPRLVR